MPGGLAGIQAGEAFVKFSPDLTGLQEKVEAAAKNAASGFQKHMAAVEKVGTNLTKFVSLPLAGVGIAAIKAASDVGESLSKVNVVFGDSARVIEDWSKRSAESIGISQGAALEAAGTFGNLFRAMGLVPEKAAELSMNIVQLAGDLASFNNANPEEVLLALRAGLVGETEPLRRFGVNINQARIEAEAFALGLAKPIQSFAEIDIAQQKVTEATAEANKAIKQYGEDNIKAQPAIVELEKAHKALEKAMAGEKVELDAAQKAQAAYSLIMKDTALAQGDFERTADGAANKTRILKAQLQDAAAAIGAQLLPVATKLLGFVSDLVGRFAELSPGMQKAIVILGGVAIAVGPVLSVGVKLVRLFGLLQGAFLRLVAVIAFNPIGAAITAVVAVIAGAVYLIIRHWDSIKAAFGAAFDWIKEHAAVFGRVLLGLLTGGLSEAVIWVVKHWDAIKAAFGAAIDAVIEFVAKLPERIGYFIGRTLRFFIDLPGNIWNALVSAVENVSRWIADMARTMMRVGPEIVDRVVTFFRELPGKVWTWLVETAVAFARWVPDMIGRARDAGANIVAGIVDFMKALPGKVAEIGAQIIQKIKELAARAFLAMKEFAGELWAGFKKGLGISSPSFIERAMDGIVRNVDRSVDHLSGSIAAVGAIPMPSAVGAGAGVAAGGGGIRDVTMTLDGVVIGRVAYAQLRELERQRGPLFQARPV